MNAMKAAEYMNERFVNCGAIVEAGTANDSDLFLIVLEGPGVRPGGFAECSIHVEACRAFLGALGEWRK